MKRKFLALAIVLVSCVFFAVINSDATLWLYSLHNPDNVHYWISTEMATGVAIIFFVLGSVLGLNFGLFFAAPRIFKFGHNDLKIFIYFNVLVFVCGLFGVARGNWGALGSTTFIAFWQLLIQLIVYAKFPNFLAFPQKMRGNHEG